MPPTLFLRQAPHWLVSHQAGTEGPHVSASLALGLQVCTGSMFLDT